MNNFELISRALSYNNSEINAVKNKTNKPHSRRVRFLFI